MISLEKFPSITSTITEMRAYHILINYTAIFNFKIKITCWYYSDDNKKCTLPK